MKGNWVEIFKFEINYHLRQPLFYVSALVFFADAILVVSTRAGEVFSSVPRGADLNAPIAIIRHLTVYSLLGLFVVTAFVASSVQRDFEQGTHMFFFTKPLRKFDYLFGRFAGSMAVSLVIMLIAAVGMAVGSFMPWQDSERIGAFNIMPYLFGLGVVVLPNLLATGAIVFALAAWSRRLLFPYLGVVVFVVLQDFVEAWALNTQNAFLGGVIEPTGLAALEITTRYWTIADYEFAFPDMMGGLLLNRVLWLVIGVGFLAWSYAGFDYSRALSGGIRRKKKKSVVPAMAPAIEAVDIKTIGAIRARDSFRVNCLQWAAQTRLEVAQVVKSAPFIVLLLIGMVFVFAFAYLMGEGRGIPVYPVTYQMLQAIGMSLGVFLTIIIIFYSGELVWKERSIGLAQLYDSLPTPNWVQVGSKLAALCLVVVTFIAVSVLTTISVQLIKGFTSIEPGLYFIGSLVLAWPYLILAVLAVFIQVAANQKFIGYLLMLVLLLIQRGIAALGLEHNLIRVGGMPRALYSDMNGYGQYGESFLWYGIYWSFGALILIALSALLWPRGSETSFKKRLAGLRAQFRTPQRVFLIVAAAGFLFAGSYVFYNTVILNEFTSRATRIERLARYERDYKRYQGIPLPRASVVRSQIDLYPDERRVEIVGTYLLRNNTNESIRTIPISIGHRFGPHDYLPFRGKVIVDFIDLPAHETMVADEELGFYVYELDQALAPGDSMNLGFNVSVSNQGFMNNRQDERIVENGTFFANQTLFPRLGYSRASELQSPSTRRKQGLPPIERVARVDDAKARDRNYLDSDWTRFETIISTSSDQIAIAPGQLQREWTEHGRRYFEYKTDRPVIELGTFHSARYEVARDTWNGVDIEVYYHKSHAYNIDRMIQTAKASLNYCTINFGPYPHRQLRIIEVPNYIGLTAFSLAETIPFSESWGFIGRVDPGKNDFVSYVTAHEVAHQWWNHQVVPGDVQGATFIAETLSQYSALMIMEAEFGPEQVREILKREVDRYLAGRSREQVAEVPLQLVENQPYIHYNKGSVIMYALKDYIGEEAVNRALRRFLEAEAFQGPPYPNSLELLEYIKEEVPPEYGDLITDMFETITLYDNRLIEAAYTRQADKAYRVTLKLQAGKLRADGRGEETAVAINDWVDIAVFGESETSGDDEELLLSLEKYHLTETDQVIEILVDQLPIRAAIDPYHMLIDRVDRDNSMAITNANPEPQTGE